jgi:hypothetical protein
LAELALVANVGVVMKGSIPPADAFEHSMREIINTISGVRTVMTRRKWEYITFKADQPTASKSQLDEFGDNGWLLVQLYPWAEKWIYVFAREVVKEPS